ncbi:MAG: bis(5'-nucleosyl)-tetraphosphatase (symmetrical) YqeK [Oscillospiraceae bacterium]|nr:bis(5'-nucleosyl)-tetraphosphatase (symmetrical) YqeK [Oscillospiraceae bacterium]
MEKEIKEKLKKNLDEKRFIHSVGVADEARRIACLYGVDENKAYLAGLLHDCAKGIKTDKQIETCDALGVEIDEWTRKCPPVAHGFLGAEIAKTEYGITDDEILNAIKYHTVGNAEMTLLQKIIYIADMTEVNRNFEGVDLLREALGRSVDEAIMLSIEQQLRLNMGRKTVIHPNIICLWNDILSGTLNNERGQ